ncbi:glycosyltransferase [Streptomyces sp. TRM66268-LWL]|uniref:Glycosyltransferase n=1 Tax=Streptomyces polyasparticus TaxID=2767826 RepID=A0ABR7SL24_9ACTN|nr:glycosyltransferase family 2 protein [Streptomyces polyasparticus]MBC9716014.1 glycosyltransferase [Streptomyces polyasparticus]
MDEYFSDVLLVNTAALLGGLTLLALRHRPRTGRVGSLAAGGIWVAMALVTLLSLRGAGPWPVAFAAAQGFAVWLTGRRTALHVPGRVVLVALYSTALNGTMWFIHFACTVDVSALTRGLLLAMIPTMLAALPMSALQTFLDAESLCRTHWKRPYVPHAEPRRTGPKVSVHVPCYSEPPDVVIATLDALARLTYEDFEVLVVDNNTKDPALWRPVEAHCEALGPRFRFHHVDPLPGAKGGALNYALAHTGPDVELIALVDADYRMEPDFLSRLVGHFEDPRLGFIQAKYDFRDWQGSAFLTGAFWGYQVPFPALYRSRNDRVATHPMGTSCLLRRRAVEQAGGWSETCVTEDSEIGVRIQAAGYTSYTFDEPLGAGLAPETFEAFKKQRFRWTYGPVQQFKEHWRLYPPRPFGRASRISRAQRLLCMHHGLGLITSAVAMVVGLPLGLAALASMLAHGERPPVGYEIWLAFAASLTATTGLRWCRFRRLAGADRTGAGLAMLVELSLTWNSTVATLNALVTSNTSWRGTSKFKAGPQGWRALAAARTETVLGLLLLGAGGLAPLDGSGFLLFVSALLVLRAGTYLAASAVSLIAERDLRAAVPRLPGPRQPRRAAALASRDGAQS